MRRKRRAKADHVAALEATPVGIDPPAQERQPGRHRHDLRAPLVQRQAQISREVDRRRAPAVQRGLVVGEEQQIVAVAQIGAAAQLLLDQQIQRMHIHIGPELAGLVADRQAARALGGEQVVAGEVDHAVGVAQRLSAAGHDQVDQAQDARVGDMAGQHAAQDGVVDAGEELLHVELGGGGARSSAA